METGFSRPPSAAGPEIPVDRHKTISAYYPKLHTLHDYILSAPTSSNSRVLLDSDSKEYRLLIKKTLCAPSTDTALPQYTTDSWGTQQEVVDRVVGEIARRSGRLDVKDVLVTSDKYASHDMPVNMARAAAGGGTANGPAAILRSRPWRILRARIGDAAFRYLLVHTSLFLPVGNNCFMQLSGVPIYDKYQHLQPGASRKRSSDPVSPAGRRNKKRRKFITDEKHENQGEKKVLKKVTKPGPAAVNIARQRLFYAQPARRPNGTLIYGLPPQHILNRLSSTSRDIPSDAACFSLLQSVFPSLFPPDRLKMQDTKLRGSPRRVPRMLGFMREILTRHARLDVGHHVRCLLNRVKTDSTGTGLRDISHSQVCRLASILLTQGLGSTVLGSEENLRVLIRHARHLIEAKQHESMSLHALIQGISVTDISWLGIPDETRATQQESKKRKLLAQDFIRWVIEDYLIPLLRNTFYVTETAATRYQTVYFAHEDWSIATKPHFESLQHNFLKELDSNERHFAFQGPLGVSAVRLIPKPTGFRPIVNLGRKIRGHVALGISTTGVKLLSANQVLRTVHQVLTFEKERKREQLGSCLFGTNEVFAPLQALKTELVRLHQKVPKLYFVKMDIKAAFDTINQDRMLEVVSDLLDIDHDYCLMLYCLLLPPASKASQGSSRRLFKQRALLDDGASMGFDDHAAEIAKPLRNAVLVDMARRRHVTKESCLQLLRKHIKENVWQIGSKLYRQKEGIPQGSKISSLLCSIFYASLEAQYLPFVHRPGSRLLRYIDDFLFITDDLFTARRFVDTMRAGFPEYGAFISPSKTLLSFIHHTLPSAVIATVNYFPFCGFLIDIQTLDIGMDHLRVLSNPINQTFALRSNRHRGSSFVGWLSRQLENRNHIAYLDTQHNSLEGVHFNIFLNFAMTAMKIPHYFQSERLTARRAHTIFDSLCLAVEYTYIAGRARVKHASRHSSQDHYGVKKADFIFLGKMAMLKVLSKKESRLKLVVDLLSQDLRASRANGREPKLTEVVLKGMEAIRTAKY